MAYCWLRAAGGLVAAAAAGIIGLCAAYVRYQHAKFAHIPGPPRDSFWFGNIPSIRKAAKEQGKVFPQFILEYVERYGDTVVVWAMWRPLVFTVNTKAIQELLVSGDYGKHPVVYSHANTLLGKRFFGHGFVHERDTEQWRMRRSAINPAFHRSYLRGIMSEVNLLADRLVATVREAAGAGGQQPVPMLDLVGRTTLDFIGKVAFDMEINSLENENSRFNNCINKLFRGILLQMRETLRYLNPFAARDLKREVREAIDLVRNTGRSLLEKRQAQMLNGDSTKEDILSCIIKANGVQYKLEGEAMETSLDDFLVLFIAGQETTASTASYIIMELGRHSQVALRMREEVDEVIGSKEEISFEDLSNLTYITQVIKEGLRLQPPATTLFRNPPHDMTIGDIVVPQGSQLAVSTYAAQRYSQYHSDPHTFDPDRFSPDSQNRPTAYSFLPFSLGTRNCVGQNLAMLEMKVILCKLIQNFEWTNPPDESFQLESVVTLKPKDGAKILVKPRT